MADLAQETFLRFARAEGYRERGRPIAYLMRIARSVCVDASRRRRLETVSLDFEVAADELGEREVDLNEALAGLPSTRSSASRATRRSLQGGEKYYLADTGARGDSPP